MGVHESSKVLEENVDAVVEWILTSEDWTGVGHFADVSSLLCFEEEGV